MLHQLNPSIQSLFSYSFTHPRKLVFLLYVHSAQSTNTHILNPSHCIFAFCLSFSALLLDLVSSHSILPQNTLTFKVMPREAGHLLPLPPLLHLPTSSLNYHCPAGCNISVSDMRCNTSVNSCWLLLWAMLWGKAKLQVAENDSRGEADLLAPPSPFLAMKPFSQAYQS